MDMDTPRGNDPTEPGSNTAMPEQAAAPPVPASAREEADPAMARLDVAQMDRLEQAHIDLVLASHAIDPDHLDLAPVIRFWSQMCISHGDLISQVAGHGVSDRVIVTALQEAQDEAERSPGMDEVTAACPELAVQLRRAVTDPDMARIWSPDDFAAQARGFRMNDLAAEVEEWDGEDVHALSRMLEEMADHCAAMGTTLTQYVDLDDLPQAALPVRSTQSSEPSTAQTG